MWYEVDPEDLLSRLGDGWEETREETILGQSLWDFVENEELRIIYRLVLDKVRSQQKATALQFRCDTPHCRRLMELTVAPVELSTNLRFTTRVLQEEEREVPLLLQEERERSQELLSMCSWCKKIQVRTRVWLEAELAAKSLGLFESDKLPALTHGMCPSCFTREMENLESYQVDVQNEPD